MFSAALFTTAKIWKQPKCPSVGEQIKQLQYIYTMEYYLAIKKKILLFATAWIELENNKPIRKRQIPYDFTYMQNLKNTINEQQNRNTHKYREQADGCQWGGGLGVWVKRWRD